MLTFAACIMQGCADDVPSADAIAHQKQEALEQEGQRQASIHNFYEKKMLKMILELRDDPKVINYAYLFAENTGKLVFIGKCVGYGIPYATQYTNPQKIQHFGESYGGKGTWLMLVDPKTGDPRVVYIEPRLVVSPIPLTGAN
jgi:hypothetical protein